MKLKSVMVIGAITAIILLVAFLPVNPSDMTPQMSDKVEIKEEISIELGTNISELPKFTEETTFENNSQFFIDDDGIKHYVIEATDSPTLGD